MKEIIYDIAGIGIGPFNLGMAALLKDIPHLNAVFFDKKLSFTWHEGMMIKGTHLQVPFYADLVTLANPQSHYTFLNYLKVTGKILRFAMRDHLYPTRQEYTAYCQWVAAQLESLYFGYKVTTITYDYPKQCYQIKTLHKATAKYTFWYARKLIIGIGTHPFVPSNIQTGESNVIHAASYCYCKEKILDNKSVCIIGSGQSAAEIFYDLLPYHEKFSDGLTWISRAERIFPMDYSSFSLEMSSPDYIRHFFKLPAAIKARLNNEQRFLYKGINASLIEAIYNLLYLESQHGSVKHVRIILNSEIKTLCHDADKKILAFNRLLTGSAFNITAGAVIFATGYQYQLPAFINPIRNRILFDNNNRYAVNECYAIDKAGKEIFIQNAEMHTHGFNAPDLGLGPYRNSIILNTILGYEFYTIETNTTFQVFEL